MSQSDFGTINPNSKSGPQLATDINSWRDALHSTHKGASRPSYATVGTLWLDDSAGATAIKLKYYDGSDDIVIGTLNETVNSFSSDLANDVVTIAKVADEVFNANRNLILNGNMAIAQRGTSFVAPVNADYTLDRWKWNLVGAGAVTVTQSSDVPTGEGFDFSLKVDVTTADTSIAADDLYDLQYHVEGFDAAHLEFGTANAKEVTLSFWVKAAKTGTHHVAFANDAANRGYSASYTIDSANTWEEKSITLTGDTTGTWIGATNAIGLRVRFVLAAGSNFHTTASNAWEAANALGTSGTVNEMDSTANNFLLTGVQLEVGPAVTPFKWRLRTTELALCQRYYAKTFPYATAPAEGLGTGAVGGSFKFAMGATQDVFHNWTYPVVMRAIPTITLFNPRSGGTSGEWTNHTTDGANARALWQSDTHTIIDNTGVGLTATNWYISATAEAEL